MIWDRERYIAHNKFEFTGREMFCEENTDRAGISGSGAGAVRLDLPAAAAAGADGVRVPLFYLGKRRIAAKRAKRDRKITRSVGFALLLI